jgi:putative zinc finger/helix-turn-helix YgiT family protein
MTVGDRTVRVLDEYYWCRRCREGFYKPAMLELVMRRAADKVREEYGLLGPEQVRAIREKHGLTPDELDRLIGYPIEFASRWEAGTLPQSTADDSLLRVLDAIPGAAHYLAELHGVELRDEKPKRRKRAA